MKVLNHYFKPYGEVERICRCGFVTYNPITEDEVIDMLKEHRGDKIYCSGEWHVGLDKNEFYDLIENTLKSYDEKISRPKQKTKRPQQRAWPRYR